MKRHWNAIVARAMESAAGQRELARLAKSPQTPGEVRLLLQREIALFNRLKEAHRKVDPPRGFQARLKSLLQRLQTGLPSVEGNASPSDPIRRGAGMRERDVMAAGRPDAVKPSRKRRGGKGTRRAKP